VSEYWKERDSDGILCWPWLSRDGKPLTEAEQLWAALHNPICAITLVTPKPPVGSKYVAYSWDGSRGHRAEGSTPLAAIMEALKEAEGE